MNRSLIVHGGARNIPDEFVVGTLTGVRAALQEVRDSLSRGDDALDIVERDARTGRAYDTPRMARGRASDDGTFEVAVDPAPETGR